MKVLVINSGSSSIKFQLLEMQANRLLATGVLERIGEDIGSLAFRFYDDSGVSAKTTEKLPLQNHQDGLKRMANWLTDSGAITETAELAAISHRVAHGGAEFSEPTIINRKVIASIEHQIPLAPLHNPANLLGIEVAMAEWPTTPQVAIFDTAFHQTIPPYAYNYALPAKLAKEHLIRRYGFHGTSHKYVAEQTANLLEKSIEKLNLIVLHLGNGASATAIQGGKSIDTSMGMTPLEGLLMGTRSGDLDPGVILQLCKFASMSIDEVDAMLNKESGLKGICGNSDMREVLERAQQGNQDATLAAEMYAYRIKKYIGAYAAVLPDLDAVVFTAGIGENSAEIRARSCNNLKHLGICVDENKNSSRSQSAFAIHSEESQVKVFVVPTNEELEMARQTILCLEQNSI